MTKRLAEVGCLSVREDLSQAQNELSQKRTSYRNRRSYYDELRNAIDKDSYAKEYSAYRAERNAYYEERELLDEFDSRLKKRQSYQRYSNRSSRDLGDEKLNPTSNTNTLFQELMTNEDAREKEVLDLANKKDELDRLRQACDEKRKILNKKKKTCRQSFTLVSIECIGRCGHPIMKKRKYIILRKIS